MLGKVFGFGERRSRQKQQNQGQRTDIRLVFEDGCCWYMVMMMMDEFVENRRSLYSNSGPLEAKQKLGLAGASL